MWWVVFRLHPHRMRAIRKQGALDMLFCLDDHAHETELCDNMNIGSWLRSLGLERYEAIFRENAIDADVLHDLTEDHLREMGLPLGARLKLLKGINALVPRSELIRPELAVAPLPLDIAERRHLTVMICDLVGS